MGYPRTHSRHMQVLARGLSRTGCTGGTHRRAPGPGYRLGRYRDLGLQEAPGQCRRAAGGQCGPSPRSRGLRLPPRRPEADLGPGRRASAACGGTAQARAWLRQGRPAVPTHAGLPGIRHRLFCHCVAGRHRGAGKPGPHWRRSGRADQQGWRQGYRGVTRCLARQARIGARPAAQREGGVHDRRAGRAGYAGLCRAQPPRSRSAGA